MVTAKNADTTEPTTCQTAGWELAERERARQALQAEIDACKQQIIEKTRCMNGLLTVNRLPPELLAEIFLHWTNATKRLSHSSHRWMEITHVCHLWREVALSSPRIWSGLTVGSFDRTREMLARSKDAPLRIAALSPYDSDAHRNLGALKLVLKELSRIEEIELRCMDVTGSQLEIGASAPLLRSFIFTGLEIPPYYASGNRSIAMAFEKVNMPRLSYLELKESYISWSSPLFKPSLTQLSFHGPGAHYRDADFAQVLRVLESMPLLQALDLTGVLPALPDDDSPLHTLDHHVSLPALRTLVISGTAKGCAFLLQHISASVTSLQVDCKIVKLAAAKILAPVIAAKLHGSWSTDPVVPLQSMHFTHTLISAWDEILPLETLEMIRYASSTEKPKTPRFKLITSGMGPESVVEMLAALALENVRVCSITDYPGDSYSCVWRKLFESIPQATELSIYDSSNSNIIDMLQQRPPVTTHQSRGRKRRQRNPKIRLLLPNLKTLSLDSVWFREYTEEPEEESVLAAYKTMLKTRQMARHQVEKLVIHNATNFDDEDCTALKHMVKEVEWDEIEDWSDGDREYDDDDEDDSEVDYSSEGHYGFPLYYDDDFDHPW